MTKVDLAELSSRTTDQAAEPQAEAAAPADGSEAGDGGNDDNYQSDPDEEQWDIEEELSPSTDRTCSSDDCTNRAVATWRSSNADEELWYTCLDCQKKDFADALGADGWPEDFVRAATPGGTEEDGEQSPSGGEADPEDDDGDEGADSNADSDADADADAGPTPKASAKTSSSKRVIDDNDNDDDVDDDGADLEGEQANQAQDQDDDGNDDVEEKWSLKAVHTATQIKKAATTCSTDGCELISCSLWVSNLTPNEPWYSCLDCQENDFEGWPEAGPDLPIETMGDEHKRIIVEKCTVQDNPAMPDVPSPPAQTDSTSSSKVAKAKDDEVANLATSPTDEGSSDGANDAGSSGDDVDENWELKLVYSAGDIKNGTQTCSTDDCGLIACSLWVSNLNPDDPDEYWHSCLDCQEKDFEGWPEVGPDLPLKSMGEDHMRIITEKCTRQDNPVMPNFHSPPTGEGGSDSPPAKTSTAAAAVGGNGAASKTVTPPPGKGLVQAKGRDATAGKAGTSKKKNVGGMVTPSPVPPSSKPAPKPSAATLALHKKWQEAAEAMGGPGTRIVVKKPEAKRLIFEMLKESFKPMNITDIYKELKAAVPSPVLKSSLDDMALDKTAGNPFDDSDSDDDDDGNVSGKKGKKKSSDAPKDDYSGSLCIKAGRNSTATLYFVDQTKLHNNGNGMMADDKNSLICAAEKSKCELELTQQALKQSLAETTKLLSEPNNEAADSMLETEEKEMVEIRKRLESARALKGNEKIKQRTKRRIDSMSASWRARKRICKDFLIMMEESTDGSVSMKKCMSGEGAIYIDSDEAVVKGAIDWKKKKARRPGIKLSNKGRTMKSPLGGGLGSGSSKLGGSTITNDVTPDEDFVAVTLDATGNVKRVYFDNEE